MSDALFQYEGLAREVPPNNEPTNTALAETKTRRIIGPRHGTRWPPRPGGSTTVSRRARRGCDNSGPDPRSNMSTQSSAPPALLLLVLVLAGSGCAGPDPSGGTAEVPPGGNILLLIADDLGNDKVGVYDEHPIRPSTPNIDRLASRGVLFRNAYAYASCSATRAAILTGRWGRRTGLGKRFNTARSTLRAAAARTDSGRARRSQRAVRIRPIAGWQVAPGRPHRAERVRPRGSFGFRLVRRLLRQHRGGVLSRRRAAVLLPLGEGNQRGAGGEPHLCDHGHGG